MLRQDGERIDQQFVLTIDLLLDLFLGAVMLAEETLIQTSRFTRERSA